jgi:hypothetical protein
VRILKHRILGRHRSRDYRIGDLDRNAISLRTLRVRASRVVRLERFISFSLTVERSYAHT